MQQKKLFLLDAYALIYRAYYALIRSPHFTTKGFNTSAIFGFCNTLDEILRKENPTHIAVCFDPKGGHTFRHELYDQYKANRDAQPEDITQSVPWIKRILKAYRIPIVENPEYEADDIIGTLSRVAQADGYTTYMMTPDKDYGQLVTDNVLMYRPALKGQGFEIRGPHEVCERYGIEFPHQVIDLLALEGDSIDNIPGCPGVGEKTAQKLIAEWGSVENLLDNIDKLKGALQRKVSENVDMIRLSKVLATIRTDVPIDVKISEFERREPIVAELLDIYSQLEFRTLARRLTSADNAPDGTSGSQATTTQSASSSQPSLFDLPGDTPLEPVATIADTPSTISLKEVIDNALKHERVAIAIDADGAEAMTARWVAIAISCAEGVVDYFTVPADAAQRTEFMAQLKPLFAGNSTVMSHDVKRDMLLLRREGIEWKAPYFDTAVAHYLLQPEMRHALHLVATAYLNIQSLETELTLSQQADFIYRLGPALTAELHTQELWSLFTDIEMPLVPVLADMEWTGARIDVAELHQLSLQLTERLHQMEQQVYELAGETFNIASPSQVGEILFGRMQLDPKAKRTKKGAYSTTEEILEKYAPLHPIVDLILKVRRLRKLLTTYINALPELINPRTGKIHTTYNQTVTATGRISSTNPNLQNIPIRTEDGRDIRRAFIADPGHLFLSADYSQIELRLMADLSRDKDMVGAFLSGEDFHSETAAKVYHIPLDQVTADQRRNAKTANFGIIYGISAFGLSERLGIPRRDAKELIDNYFNSYPGVREYLDRCISEARERGYVTTVMGRKRFLPEINSRNAVVRGYAERNAVNAPLQGSAADIIKRAMIDIWRELRDKGLKSKMIMQVHDELIFDVVPDELSQVQEIVTHLMSQAYT
ncbi:MAG: DNA polymerase I, partial [Muribaculaceae bacterium]|nr:DNA polymerase I [Muribaculaceae bacterium]